MFDWLVAGRFFFFFVLVLVDFGTSQLVDGITAHVRPDQRPVPSSRRQFKAVATAALIAGMLGEDDDTRTEAEIDADDHLLRTFIWAYVHVVEFSFPCW